MKVFFLLLVLFLFCPAACAELLRVRWMFVFTSHEITSLRNSPSFSISDHRDRDSKKNWTNVSSVMEGLMLLWPVKASMTIEELLESGGWCGNLAMLPVEHVTCLFCCSKSEDDADDMDDMDMVLTTDAVRRGMCERFFSRCCNTKLMTVTAISIKLIHFPIRNGQHQRGLTFDIKLEVKIALWKSSEWKFTQEADDQHWSSDQGLRFAVLEIGIFRTQRDGRPRCKSAYGHGQYQRYSIRHAPRTKTKQSIKTHTDTHKA